MSAQLAMTDPFVQPRRLLGRLDAQFLGQETATGLVLGQGMGLLLGQWFSFWGWRR